MDMKSGAFLLSAQVTTFSESAGGRYSTNRRRHDKILLHVTLEIVGAEM